MSFCFLLILYPQILHDPDKAVAPAIWVQDCCHMMTLRRKISLLKNEKKKFFWTWHLSIVFSQLAAVSVRGSGTYWRNQEGGVTQWPTQSSKWKMCTVKLTVLLFTSFTSWLHFSSLDWTWSCRNVAPNC